MSILNFGAQWKGQLYNSESKDVKGERRQRHLGFTTTMWHCVIMAQAYSDVDSQVFGSSACRAFVQCVSRNGQVFMWDFKTFCKGEVGVHYLCCCLLMVSGKKIICRP